jgi:KipI family sensor histidine kinase inhibitor
VSPLPRIEPLGDAAFLLTLADAPSPEASARVVRLAAAVRAAGIAAVQDVVPAYCAVAVFFHPLAPDPDALAARLDDLLRQHAAAPVGPDPPARSRLHVVPVRYDGPDLDDVAHATGRAPDEVVRLHADRVYDVYLLGFVPGFAYLGLLDPALVLPRRTVPRRRVPPGSVAIAGAQTAVYPLETPGGWHILGHTDLLLFDPSAERPSRFAPGDRVRFEPILR